MRKSDLFYELPERLIAQTPPVERSGGRLLRLDGPSGTWADSRIIDLPDFLQPEDLLVFNDTKVIAARLYGHKASGGRIEILVERLLGERLASAFIRASKAPKAGSELRLDGGGRIRVRERCDDRFDLEFLDAPVLQTLEAVGHIPLPPYIDRPAGEQDQARYQTVFARVPGAVAAPTAGLHFDVPLLERIAAKGVQRAYVTLHVGSGTFQPLRVENLDEHRMHSEFCEVGAEAVEAIEAARAQGGRIVAVGTTVARTLESACLDGTLKPFRGESNLFIRPGFRFRCVDVLVTNFHLPESTLLSLVCAFAGYRTVMDAYRHAVEQEYRFFSYGDAMFITRRPLHSSAETAATD